MSHSDCRCEQLASSPVGQIAVCHGCGQVHLTMHHTTVRFELDAFRALATMTREAQQRIDLAMQETASSASSMVVGNLH